MIVSMSIPVSGISKLPRMAVFERIFDRLPALQYGLATSVIGLVVEIALFVLYLLGLNSTLGSTLDPLPYLVSDIAIVF